MKAIYAFSGDPITFGHIDVIERAAATYDRVTVGIGGNPNKIRGYLFSAEERLDMARQSTAHLSNVDCAIFEGLLAQFAYRNGYQVIIRGVRNSSDLEAELTLYNVNHLQFSNIDTIFLPTRPTLSHISSSVVKALVREGGDVSEYVPIFVKQKLEQKISHQFRIGVTGGIGTGKSYVVKRLIQKIPNAQHISLDEISQYILSKSPEPAFQETRSRIAQRFGKKILKKDGSTDRRLLGTIVFQDPKRLAELNEIMVKPILARLYEICRDNHAAGSSDALRIMFLESSIFVESELTHLVNHCVILVKSPKDLKIQRLQKSQKTGKEETRQKIEREISDRERRIYLKRMLKNNANSFLIEFENIEESIPETFVREVQEYIDRCCRA
jgi:pantetheine-phosphate adenylyltransferase